jgi:hypothetical protein
MTDQTETPVSESSIGPNLLSGDVDAAKKVYTIRIQSNRFHDDDGSYSAHEINKLIKRDLSRRATEAAKDLPGIIFPDTAFGFPINDQFVQNFYGSFLSNFGVLDPTNFGDETKTATFLNRMISTIAHFLDATEKVSLKPLRYFTAANSNKPLKGNSMKRKPDIILIRLIDGYLRDSGTIEWHDVQALIEHTCEKKPPQRLPDTTSIKSYISICSQPERDFVICLCMTGTGFHIVITDHVGQVETDVIPFDHTLAFIRIMMGLAFLPDSLIGIDTTITRYETGKPSKVAFASEYRHFPYVPRQVTRTRAQRPKIVLLSPESDHESDSGSSVDGLSTVTSIIPTSIDVSRSPGDFGTISIGPSIYRVVCVLFNSQTLIGRATKVFLVQLPDNRYAALKDSWITVDRAQEAEFLQGLHIPFGPELINHRVLRNTNIFRKYPVKPSAITEIREKRRVVMYPAGVHISDFTSLWELLVAFLDVVIGMEN